MDAKRFVAEFGHIANAPGGVARLRELILALAVQGRLVAQDGSDEPADAQLNRIRKIATNKPSAGRNRNPSNQPRQASNQSIPHGWASTRLCELMRVLNGRAYSKSELLESGTPVLRVGNLFTSSRWYYSDLELEEDKYCDSGDLLYAWSASFGPFIWSGKKVIFHYHIWKLDFFSEADVNKRFLYLWLRAKTQEIKAAGRGISMAHMTKGKFEQLPLALPPLEEQSRIVAKVDELITLCDKLEAQQKSRRLLQTALRQSVLQAIATATSPGELHTAWKCLSKTFPSLFAGSEDVDDLVATVKSLAVRGALAGPSPHAVNLDEIRRACQETRDSYIGSGLMRRQKLIDFAAIGTNYPAHWAVSAFDEVAIVIGGVTKGRVLRDQRRVTCPYLAVANVQRGHFKLNELKTIEIAVDELAKYKVEVDDLLITEGGDWDKLGRTAIWDGSVENCLHQNHVFKARVPSELLSSAWVELVFNSDIGREYFAGASKQTTNLASINMTQLRSFPLPIPPFDEQQAILETLAALMQQCNEWKSQLSRKKAVAALMAATAISSLTGIVNESIEEHVRAPRTQLSAQLHASKAPSVKEQAPLAAILVHTNGSLNARELWQRYGGEIDAFYAQLKTEVANGWIREPGPAVMNEIHDETVSA